MKRERLAWAAGLFDAEGCFSTAGKYPAVSISNTDVLLLRRLRTEVPVGNTSGPYVKRATGFRRRPQWVLQVYGREKVQYFAASLWPWLSDVKREQASLVLERRTSRRSQPLITDRREALAWAAGFFDGEGCFSRPKSAMTVRITNTDRVLLERFRASVGFGTIYGPYDPPKTTFGAKPHFVYAASGFERVQAVLALLWFRLGRAKRVKAVEILRRYRTTYGCGHVRGPEPWRKHCPACFRPGPKPGSRRAGSIVS